MNFVQIVHIDYLVILEHRVLTFSMTIELCFNVKNYILFYPLLMNNSKHGRISGHRETFTSIIKKLFSNLTADETFP